ncbi:MAG TPA: DNA translocase FtsK 4TM domain-containing protein [Candidatus Bathyarchaeia archaeon]|nr:DNA translocase FtsK 4TM domain-containing protein [Candidatus Bathyarchaeia archaeon]
MPEDGSEHRLSREAGGFGLAIGALLLALAVGSYSPGLHANMIGPFGAALADVLVQALGLGAYTIPLTLGGFALGLFLGRPTQITPLRAAAAILALVAGATLAQLAFESWRGMPAGGVIGGFSRVLLHDSFGEAGAWVIAGASLPLLLALATGQSLVGLGASLGRGGLEVTQRGLARALSRLGFGRAALSHEGPPILLRSVIGEPGNVRRERPERRPPVVISKPPPQIKERSEKGGKQVELPFASGRSYCLPDLALLDPVVESDTPLDHDALIASSRVLEAKLATFEIDGQVQGIHPGPVITTYEFEPAPGIKVQKIVALADDLAMAMRAMSVRILAPMPGRSVVGIEVSNPRRERVSLREIVASESFRLSKSVLTLALGKDTTGNPVAADLARMPHLLVAGATGAGKSVFLNALISSILMRAAPRDVRFVLIDPKMLEMSTFERIPHLLVPVITDAKPAVTVLNNLVDEMNQRYRLLRDKGVRNLDDYNRAVAEDGGGREVIELDARTSEAGGEEAAEGEAEAEIVHQHLPRIVVIIDELADLMMSRRDSEEPITRLAQKARAAGIHLVVATQRPSVDVITGLIKANFPARISFQVAGRVDSKTILDSIGAERLLGEGDMLFLPPGTSKLQRLHGAYVSDGELKHITDFVRRQESPRYNMDLLADDEGEEPGEVESGEEPFDEMYDAAVRVVTETGKASISYVQRRLQVGYNRAARMIERMEREGVVSAADHRGTREVIARRIED